MSSPTSNAVAAELEKVESEYSAVLERLQFLDTRNDTARTFGLGGVGAVLILAIQQGLALVALGGLLIAVAFMLIDGYNAYQFRVSAEHAKRLELILAAKRDVDRRQSFGLNSTRAEEKLKKRALAPRGGIIGEELKSPGQRELEFLTPWPIFRVLYPGLLLVACIATIVLSFDDDPWAALTVDAVAVLVVVVVFSLLNLVRLPRKDLASAGAALVMVASGIIGLVWAIWAPPLSPAHVVLEYPSGATDTEVRASATLACNHSVTALEIRWRGPVAHPVVAHVRDGGETERRVLRPTSNSANSQIADLRLENSTAPWWSARCRPATPTLGQAGGSSPGAGSAHARVPTNSDLAASGGQTWVETKCRLRSKGLHDRCSVSAFIPRVEPPTRYVAFIGGGVVGLLGVNLIAILVARRRRGGDMSTVP